MLRKSFDIVETSADADFGTFEALVSVFGNVDHVGDRVMPGAFRKSLEKWRQSGDPVPVILSHKADDPMAHIGVADPNDIEETDRGLVVKAKLDIADNEVAKQVHRLMKRRSLKEFSFGYFVPQGGERRAKDGVNELVEIDLFEVGPTLKGANPATELHAVKSALETEVSETKQPDAESSTVGSLVARMRELAQGDPPSPEAMLAFARRVVSDLAPKTSPQDEQKTAVEDTRGEDRSAGKPEVQDPLRKRADDLALQFASAGLSRRKPPTPKPEPERQVPSESELRDKASELMLELLTGDISG